MTLYLIELLTNKLIFIMGFKKWLKKIKEDFNYSFDKKEIKAEEAFSRSLMSNNLSEEELKNTQIRNIRWSIREKIRGGNMSLSVDITPSNKIYLEDIKKHFEELGYTVVIINSSIIPELGPDEGYIWLSWKRTSIKK